MTNNIPFIQQFNNKFHQEYAGLINDLNKWVCKTNGLATWNVPEVNLTGSLTIAPQGAVHAFALNPPVSGLTRNVLFNTEKQTNYPRIVVGRIIIGYTAANRFIEGSFDLKPWIYAALQEVCATKGLSVNTLTFGNYLITFNRPGMQAHEYARELEHTAGIELRFFSDCISIDQIKEIMNEQNQNT